jgi:hypothetical protein
VGATGAAAFGQLADRVDTPEVLASVRFDDHRRVEPRRLVAFPDEELAAFALKSDFYEMRHIMSNEE